MASLLESNNIGKLLLRLAVGGLMLFHGLFKLIHGVSGIQGMLAARGWPGFVAYGAYVGEILAPILIIIGFRARPAALVVAFDMVMAIWLARAADIFKVKESGGGWAIELELLFLLGAFALFFMGAGSYAVSKGRSVWD